MNSLLSPKDYEAVIAVIVNTSGERYSSRNLRLDLHHAGLVHMARHCVSQVIWSRLLSGF